MRTYTVLAVLTLQAGASVALTGKQAGIRAHALKPVKVNPKTGDGIFQVLEPVQFKAGETIATDLELNKALATTLEPVEDTRTKAQARKQAEADAADLQAMKAKAANWDALQPDLEALQTKAALFDRVPTDVQAAVMQQVEAEIKAAAAARTAA